MQREQFGINQPVEAGSRRVTPGVSVGASLGDIGIPGVPGKSAPAGRKEETLSGNPRTRGKHPGDGRSSTAPVRKNVC